MVRPHGQGGSIFPDIVRTSFMDSPLRNFCIEYEEKQRNAIQKLLNNVVEEKRQ